MAIELGFGFVSIVEIFHESEEQSVVKTQGMAVLFGGLFFGKQTNSNRSSIGQNQSMIDRQISPSLPGKVDHPNLGRRSRLDWSAGWSSLCRRCIGCALRADNFLPLWSVDTGCFRVRLPDRDNESARH